MFETISKAVAPWNQALHAHEFLVTVLFHLGHLRVQWTAAVNLVNNEIRDSQMEVTLGGHGEKKQPESPLDCMRLKQEHLMNVWL